MATHRNLDGSEGVGARGSHLALTNLSSERYLPWGVNSRPPVSFSHSLDDGRTPLNFGWVDGGRLGRPLKLLSNEMKALGAKNEHLQVTVSSGRGFHARVNFYGACENQVRISGVLKEPLLPN
jgi:hypothetical protein